MTDPNANAAPAPHQKDRHHKDRWFGDATLVAALTGLAYASAYAFETGRAGYFGYPVSFISIQLSTALTALGVMLFAGAVLGFVGFLLYLLISFIPSRPVSVVLRTFWRQFGAAGTVAMAVVYSNSPDLPSTIFGKLLIGNSILFLALVTWMDIPFLVRVTREHRHEMSILDIWDQVAKARWSHFLQEAEEKHSDDTLGDRFLQTHWLSGPFRWLFAIAIPGMFAVGVLAALGEYSAKRSSHFLVTQVEPRLIVLTRYADFYVTARYVDSTQTVRREYGTMQIGQAGAVLFRDVHISDLQIEPPCHVPACRW